MGNNEMGEGVGSTETNTGACVSVVGFDELVGSEDTDGAALGEDDTEGELVKVGD